MYPDPRNIAVPVFMLMSLLTRASLELQVRMGEVLRTFSVKHASCAEEADRPLVESSIVAFVRCTGRVPSSVTSEDALSAFDKLVQEELRASIDAAFGTACIHYDKIVAILVISYHSQKIEMLAMLYRNQGVSLRIWAVFITSIIFTFCVVPLATAFGSKMMRLRPSASRPLTALLLLATMCLQTCLVLLCMRTQQILYQTRAADGGGPSASHVAVATLLQLLLVCLTWYVFRRHSGESSSARTSTDWQHGVAACASEDGDGAGDVFQSSGTAGSKKGTSLRPCRTDSDAPGDTVCKAVSQVADASAQPAAPASYSGGRDDSALICAVEGGNSPEACEQAMSDVRSEGEESLLSL